jgi:hypothetical protein
MRPMFVQEASRVSCFHQNKNAQEKLVDATKDRCKTDEILIYTQDRLKVDWSFCISYFHFYFSAVFVWRQLFFL